MQDCEFSPRVIINHSFYNSQPDIPLLTSIMEGNFGPRVFVDEGSLYDECPSETLVANADLFRRLAGYNGHIVVRVAPGGMSSMYISVRRHGFRSTG